MRRETTMVEDEKKSTTSQERGVKRHGEEGMRFNVK